MLFDFFNVIFMFISPIKWFETNKVEKALLYFLSQNTIYILYVFPAAHLESWLLKVRGLIYIGLNTIKVLTNCHDYLKILFQNNAVESVPPLLGNLTQIRALQLEVGSA